MVRDCRFQIKLNNKPIQDHPPTSMAGACACRSLHSFATFAFFRDSRERMASSRASHPQIARPSHVGPFPDLPAARCGWQPMSRCPVAFCGFFVDEPPPRVSARAQRCNTHRSTHTATCFVRYFLSDLLVSEEVSNVIRSIPNCCSRLWRRPTSGVSGQVFGCQSAHVATEELLISAVGGRLFSQLFCVYFILHPLT